MGKGEIRTKNQKMAEYMKKKGIKRSTMQCPHGHSTAILGFPTHIMTCKFGLARRVK